MEIALLFLPLLASIISGFFGKYIGDRTSEMLQVYLFQFQRFIFDLYFIKLLLISMKIMLLLLLGLILEP